MAGSSKQTTTQNSAPWSGAQPALNTALAGAMNLYNNGGVTYKGNTVVPWSSMTQKGMDNIQGIANSNINGQGSSGIYQNAINNSGLTAPMLDALSGFQSITQNNGYNSDMQTAAGNMRSLANSQYAVSPELQKVLDAQAAKVSDSVNLNAAAAGRYGSGANQTLLAQNIGDLTNQTILSDYNNFLGRRDSANSNLANLGGNALANRSAALGNIANLGQQGFNNVGAAYTGLTQPAQSFMNVGSMIEDLSAREMNDELRKFNAQKDSIEWLNSIGSGAGQLGGTRTTTQPGQNPFLTAAGYGLTGLGLLGGL